MRIFRRDVKYYVLPDPCVEAGKPAPDANEPEPSRQSASAAEQAPADAGTEH